MYFRAARGQRLGAGRTRSAPPCDHVVRPHTTVWNIRRQQAAIWAIKRPATPYLCGDGEEPSTIRPARLYALSGKP